MPDTLNITQTRLCARVDANDVLVNLFRSDHILIITRVPCVTIHMFLD